MKRKNNMQDIYIVLFQKNIKKQVVGHRISRGIKEIAYVISKGLDFWTWNLKGCDTIW